MAALTRHSHFLGHSSNVNCLRFGRKSGQVAATGGDDNMVNLWRMRERETKNIMSLAGHQSPVESLVFDPTERKLIAGSKAGSIKAFDLEAGKVSRTLKGHMSTCTTVDYHLYGDYVASGSLDTIVKVWDLRTKSCMQTFKGHKSEVTKVCFTPDGRWLTSGGMDGTIKIWDLTAGRMLREFPDHGGAITSLEFNPEEFILVSASTDKTIRIWDVQEFALIGVTPTDSATTTAICHTVSDPHSGKYMVSCSPDAVRVWSYETAIECHDSIACHKPKDVGVGEVQADITMLEDMKVMGGTIQDAFVSVWILDLNQMRPFQQSSKQQASRAPPAVVSPPPVIHPRVTAETSSAQSAVPTSARGRPASGGHVRQSRGEGPPQALQPQGGTAARPVTPGVVLPQSLPAPVAASTPQTQGNSRISHVEEPRRSAARKAESRPPSSEAPLASRERPEADNPQSVPGVDEQAPHPQAIITTDYIMELRCGMDTSVKTFRARQKCMQELLTHWEKGDLHGGLRFVAQLPNGKREAAVVDVLQTTDLQALGIDLEACLLLLSLVVELFSSKFESYLSVAVEAGQRLFNAFSPVVKDSRDARQFQSRGVNLAGEERVQRCAACDALFQDMQLLVQRLEQSAPYPSLVTKVRALSRSMADFTRNSKSSIAQTPVTMRRRYDRRRAKAAAVGVASTAVAPAATAAVSSDVSAAPLRRLSAQMKLHVHGPEFQNGDELVLNPEFFPQLKELALDKYVVEIFHASESERLREERFVASVTPFSDADYKLAHDHLLLEIPPSSATPIKGKLQVSVVKETAAAFQLAPFNDVTLRFIEKSRVELDFVEISLKDQFLSRRDLWYLKQSLVGMALHVGKNVRVQGTRWQVMDLRTKSDAVRSGVVSTTTKFAFRSRTSRVMWLVQMSPEMWEIANSGQLYLEILLQVVQNVLNKWIKHKVSHSLTIILFARSYYPELDGRSANVGYGALATPPRSLYSSTKRSTTRRALYHTPPMREPASESAFPFSSKSDDMFAIGVDEDGRHYQDFYKIVAFDSAVTEVEPLLVQLKEEMNEFPHLCGWRSPRTPPAPFKTELPGEKEQPRSMFPESRRGVPSNARDGNLLEAINIVLNIFDKHHIDRHLARSGQSVVLITAGNGIFRVKQRLAEITEQRMMDHGVGIDMVSLSTQPLHKCPLFVFKHSDESELALPRADGIEGANGGGGSDLCTCGSMQAQMSHHGRSSSHQRRSRTDSSDLGDPTETPLPSELSAKGSQRFQQQVQTPPAPHQPSQPLCKHCRGRNAQRKRFDVPLWIPLSFVQERMMVEHKCPLDSDITNSCLICCPFGREQVRGFEPLPMWRMFNDTSTWQEPPRSSRSTQTTLPKPLERLLNRFQSTETPGLKDEYDSDDENGEGFQLQTRTFSSDLSFLLDEDYLSLGRDSELVRARAPSLASVDDDENGYGRSPEKPLPKVPSFSLADRQRYQREFDSYDDAVFDVPAPKGSAKNKNGDDEYPSGFVRTPPLKPMPAPSQGNNVLSRKPSRHYASVSRATGSTGGDEGMSHRVQGDANRWRSPQQSTNGLTTSPGRPVRGSVHSENRSRRPSTIDRPSAVEVGSANTEGEKRDGDEASSPELAAGRGRTLGGSLPSTYQLLTESSKFGHSPGMVQPPESKSNDAIFQSRAFLRQITSNQRRWSQVRPNDGNNPYRLVQSVLKWKSLCFPALLPLTTDFIPGGRELEKHYEHFIYSVTLPESDEQSGVTFRDYKELVMEMVAQRFSQDFQLVTVEESKSSSSKKLANRVVFRLSMGHRIHEIMYNEETQTVDLKRYVQTAMVQSDTDVMEYRYALWSPVAESFLFATQKFRKYSSEYQWNYLDQLICGYFDDMTEAIRYKRILFCITPPVLTGKKTEDEATLTAYTERCRKFFEFLKSKAAEAAAFPSIKIASEYQEDLVRSGPGAFKNIGRENIRMVLHAPDSPTSQNWLVTRLDTELSATQCFHMEVQWLVCRSALVEDFIQGLLRRSKQLGIEVLQVAENGISKDLDLHPLISPIFLPLRDPAQQRVVEAALVDRFQFYCEALHEIPHVHLNHDEEYKILDKTLGRLLPNSRQAKFFYRQYVHRSLACFVRVTQTGLVWISNRKLQCQDIQPIFEAIRNLVESVTTAHGIINDVMGDVMARIDELAVEREQSTEEEVQDDSEGKIDEQTAEDVQDKQDVQEPVVEEEVAPETPSDAVSEVEPVTASEPDDEEDRVSDLDHDASTLDCEKENIEAAGNVEEAAPHHSNSNVPSKPAIATLATTSATASAVPVQKEPRTTVVSSGHSGSVPVAAMALSGSATSANGLHGQVALL